MNRFIVVTTIYPPTDAIRAFAKMANFHLVVVADLKTPRDWHCNNVDFISLEEQERADSALAGVLPFNHYCRKMLGYLKAMKCGADCIVDTDDDNIPKDNWGYPEFANRYDCISGVNGFLNVYQLFTDQKIWPRGLPLNLANTNFALDKKIVRRECNVGIWQGLADGDPDVDAVYRLTSDQSCHFRSRDPVVLEKGAICPFNTQNTLVRKELFALLYLPTYVTFRFTDILRGLVAQPIMWLYDYHLGFTDATVVQERNPHDYMSDFISEVPMYQHCTRVIEVVSNAASKSKSIESNLYDSYDALLREKIVCDKEMRTLDAWLRDLSKRE